MKRKFELSEIEIKEAIFAYILNTQNCEVETIELRREDKCDRMDNVTGHYFVATAEEG